eukprot:Pgem_evm1s4731
MYGYQSEKRMAQNGQYYSKQEFIDYYGYDNGMQQWNTGGGLEKRTAPDGKNYTRDEFIEYFGVDHGARKWDQASPSGGMSRTMGMGMGMVQPKSTTRIEQQRCIRCHGNGFVHDSNMRHDKAENMKCFFCESCPTCRGQGSTRATTHVETNAYGQSMITSNADQPCIRCRGNGFVHNSGMRHDKSPDSKCFFCESCSTCRGSGVQKGVTESHTTMGMGQPPAYTQHQHHHQHHHQPR